MDIKTIIQAIYYISIKLNKTLDKLTILKLLFFADRYHLQMYGRMITEDTYYAMELGPVASNVKDLFKDDFLSKEEKKYLELYLEKNDTNFSHKGSNKNLEKLSETDLEALDFAINNFGKESGLNLSKITHEYPEWKRFEETFKKNKTKRELIVVEDFFEKSDLKEDPFKIIPKEVIEYSKQIYFHGE